MRTLLLGALAASAALAAGSAHADNANVPSSSPYAVMAPGGAYLVCDHFLGEGGLSNDQLYMTVAQQRDALLAAGFADVEAVLVTGGLALHRAQ